ncbi:hypothetical protein NKH36_31360 [Mesorhizobium sp. M1312]
MQAGRERFSAGMARAALVRRPHMFGIAEGSMAGKQFAEKRWRKRL